MFLLAFLLEWFNREDEIGINYSKLNWMKASVIKGNVKTYRIDKLFILRGFG